jgi:hypothetical protein
MFRGAKIYSVIFFQKKLYVLEIIKVILYVKNIQPFSRKVS